MKAQKTEMDSRRRILKGVDTQVICCKMLSADIERLDQEVVATGFSRSALIQLAIQEHLSRETSQPYNQQALIEAIKKEISFALGKNTQEEIGR